MKKLPFLLFLALVFLPRVGSAQAYSLSASSVDYTNAPDGVVFTSPKVTGVAIGTGGGAIATHIFQVPAGKTFVCTGGFAEVTAVTGGNSGALVAYIRESGANAMLTHNGTSAASTPAVGSLYTQVPSFNSAPYKMCAAGNYVDFFVSSANNSTSCTATVYVTGFYR